MRLDIIEDSEFKPNENFSIKIKNHKCYFSVKGDKHIIGSKLYPIGKKAEIFTESNTSQGDFQQVAKAIENGNWIPSNGRCYTHAEILYKAFNAFGIEAKYYSGWVFPTGTYPVHHAWVVVDGNVYDIAINISSKKLMNKQVAEGRDPYSKECVKEVKEIEKVWKPITEHFTWGMAHMIYIGAENTPNGARNQYNKCVDDVGMHPSYKSMGKGEKHIKSRYQKLLDDV